MLKNKKIPVVTLILLGLNIIGMIYEYKNGENLTMYRYAMFQGALRRGEYLRIVTNAFLHFGISHFLCNMVCLVSFGLSLENRIGPVKYAVIYAAAILGAGILIDQAGGRGLHAGASGAIWGLMTATLVYSLRNGQNPAYALRGILLNLVYSFSAGVSWQAHIGGGIGGLVIALLICGNWSKNRYPDSGRYNPYGDDPYGNGYR